MIVVDANVIVHAVIASDLTGDAHRVATRDAQWVLPALWRYEVTSAVTTLVRGKALSGDNGRAALGQAQELVGDREVAVHQERVLETALQLGLSAYDAQYITLALYLGVPCVTTDSRLIAKAPDVAVSLAGFAQSR